VVFGRDPANKATVGQIRGEYAALIRIDNVRECILEFLSILMIPFLPQVQGETVRARPGPQDGIFLPGAEPKRPLQDFQRTLRTRPR